MRLRRGATGFLSYGGGAGIGSMVLFLWVFSTLVRQPGLLLAVLCCLLSIIPALWFSGSVRVTDEELIAGSRFRPQITPLAEIEMVVRGRVPCGRGFADGLQLIVGGQQVPLPLSGNLGADRMDTWTRTIGTAAGEARKIDGEDI